KRYSTNNSNSSNSMDNTTLNDTPSEITSTQIPTNFSLSN
ncbi:21190_t:CDS:1, partial [Gigaspora rosea]